MNLARFTLAKTLAELGKDAEAAEEYARCVEWQTAKVGAQHPSLRQQLLLLRGCLERSGQPEAAAEVQRRLEQLRRGGGGAQRPPPASTDHRRSGHSVVTLLAGRVESS
eukprot:COSAG01_NODE_8280_length_2846_cov_2.831452_4_plen_109_part_00